MASDDTTTVNVIIGISDRAAGIQAALYLATLDVLQFEQASVNAEIDGYSIDPTYGRERATWIAATLPAANLPGLRASLRIVARRYRQTSIALTVGATEFVESAYR